MIRNRVCVRCARPDGRLRLRVVFFRTGFAKVLCDGCLEAVQRTVLAWAYCYLPAAVRS